MQKRAMEGPGREAGEWRWKGRGGKGIDGGRTGSGARTRKLLEHDSTSARVFEDAEDSSRTRVRITSDHVCSAGQFNRT